MSRVPTLVGDSSGRRRGSPFRGGEDAALYVEMRTLCSLNNLVEPFSPIQAPIIARLYSERLSRLRLSLSGRFSSAQKRRLHCAPRMFYLTGPASCLPADKRHQPSSDLSCCHFALNLSAWISFPLHLSISEHEGFLSGRPNGLHITRRVFHCEGFS